VLWVTAGFFLTAVIWAYFSPLDEITRAQGQVSPSSQMQIIQSLEGGIISNILVSEGDIVEKGQVLMIIDDTQFSSNFKESQVKTLALQVKIARLTAETNGTPFIISKDLDEAAGNMDEDENELYKSRQRDLKLKIEIAQNEIQSTEQEVAELKRRQEQLKISHNLVSKELSLTYPLAKSGAVSQVDVLRLERTVNDLKGEVESNELALPKLQANLEATKKKIDEITTNFRTDARMQLNDARAALKSLFESNLALADRVARTSIRSPVKGTVNQIKIKTIGGIIQPGQDMMEIVPLEDSLLIEAEVRPADIGFINLNMQAMVKLTAYDFSIYGGLKAKVVHISADTILNEKKEGFYVVKLRTDKNYLEHNNKKLPIITGMRASVDILTGKKSVLDYVFKPILKAKQNALTER
jgi:adhesin transport system membrane fusion protein